MQCASTAFAIAQTLACACGFYAINYGTQEIVRLVRAQERDVEQQKSAIKVLEAELAYVARPERIEPVARALGMQSVTTQQYVKLEDLTARGNRLNDALRPRPAAQGASQPSSR